MNGGKKQKKKTSPKEPEPDPELFRLLSLNPWESSQRQLYDNQAVEKVVMANPDAVCCKYEFKAPGRGTLCRYPLYRAVSLGATLTVVQLMHAACPDAIREESKFRSTPLHAACAYRATIDVIEYILQHAPESVMVQTKHGYTPLHNACEYGVSSSQVITLLIDAYPEALMIRNKLGKTPYETALRNSADPIILDILVKYEAKLDGEHRRQHRHDGKSIGDTDSTLDELSSSLRPMDIDD